MIFNRLGNFILSGAPSVSGFKLRAAEEEEVISMAVGGINLFVLCVVFAYGTGNFSLVSPEKLDIGVCDESLGNWNG